MQAYADSQHEINFDSRIGTHSGLGRRGSVGQNLEEMPQSLVLDHPTQCCLLCVLTTVVARVLASSSWTSGHGGFVEP